MLIRVQCNVEVWRIDGLDIETSKVEDVLQGTAKTHLHVNYELRIKI